MLRLSRPFKRRRVVHVALLSALLPVSYAWADLAATKTATSTVNNAAWVANSGGAYGRAINGNSFETSTITTFNGYQYTAYWQNVSNAGRVAVARRPVGSSTWTAFTLPNTITNGANDAHNVISMGLNPSDGTIHLAYDMHGHTLRYRVSAQNVLNAPATTAWTSSIFSSAETSQLTPGTTVTAVTYPMFVRTPDNNLQFFYRNGASGAGSWLTYDYSGATHAWSDGHQIDDGFVGSYTGTVTSGDANRNDYPNGWTYGSNGRLHSVFTYREGATGAANHDLMYVYSDDGGNIWKNNAGTVVSNAATGLKFNLTTPGLIVRPLDESQTLMNQQGQGVDHANQIHSIGWHRDPAKGPNTTQGAPWSPPVSSYYQNWRDDLGNWHESKLPGNVGARPKIYFDADDNAYAIYQVASGGANITAGNGNNLYILNGDLVISAASKASNWTDWKIVTTEAGNFVSEAQADPELFASTGVLSVIMQSSPTQTGNQGTNLRVFDYGTHFTAPAVRTFAAADGNWSAAANWSGAAVPSLNSVAQVNGGNVATVDSSVALLDNRLLVGTGGTNGTLRIAAGGTLDLLHAGLFNSVYGGSIVVGADAASVGTYEQTGGSVSAWRVAVGDYATTTSGGGVSSATVSGGSLSTYELDVAFSANASSSGSSFNQSGGSVTVNGETILGEFGNSATLNLTGGTFTAVGGIREGFNKTNASTLILDGGDLDVNAGRIDVDNLQLRSGRLRNLGSLRTTGTIVKNMPGTVSLAGTNTFTNAIQIDAGAIRAEGASALGAASAGTTISGGTTTGQLQLSGGIFLAEPLTLGGRQPFVATSTAPHVVNVDGSNFLTNTINLGVGGNQYTFRSDAGTLGVSGTFNNAFTGGAADVRTLNLDGAGTGIYSGAVVQASGANASVTAITKRGGGTWRLTGSASTFTGTTTIEAGTLEINAATRGLVLSNAGGLDVRGGAATFPYAIGSSPQAAIVPLLDAGYDVGFASGQIRSGTADTSHGLGWVDDNVGTLRVAYAFYGDATLDGRVDFDDLLVLAQNYGATNGGTWAGGDFNYSGTVDFDDLLSLAQNYGAGFGVVASGVDFAADWALARSLVPEPTAAVSMFALAGLARRRRSRGGKSGVTC